MIQPEYEDGVQILNDFYVKPYKMKLFGGLEGKEKYLICYFALITVNKNEPMIIKAQAYWLMENLLKKYQTNNRAHLLDVHKAKIPKDDIFYIDGILKSSLPGDYSGTTLESAISLVEAEKSKNTIDTTFSNVICINNIYNKTNASEIINSRLLDTARELDKKLGFYIELREKALEHDAAIRGQLGEVINKEKSVNNKDKQGGDILPL